MLRTSLDKQERELATLKRRCASLQEEVEQNEEARAEEQRQAEFVNVQRKRAKSAARRPPSSDSGEEQEDAEAVLWPSHGRAKKQQSVGENVGFVDRRLAKKCDDQGIAWPARQEQNDREEDPWQTEDDMSGYNMAQSS